MTINLFRSAIPLTFYHNKTQEFNLLGLAPIAAYGDAPE